MREEGGEILGTGILVGAQWVLTCAHVVEEVERVDVAEGASGDPLASGGVSLRGDPDGADDVALVELDTPLARRGTLRFGLQRRGDEFHTKGFSKSGTEVFGKVGGSSEYFDWFHLDAAGSYNIEEGFSGGAVWIPARGIAVGMVTHYGRKRMAYAIPREVIKRFLAQIQLPEWVIAERCRPFISRVEQRLQDEETRNAILAVAKAADRPLPSVLAPAALAETLCLNSDPDDLVVDLCRAFCELDDRRGLDSAEKVFGVLAEALPAAVLRHWPLDWPESSAKDVQIGLLSRVLAEFAMAASEGSPASFHRNPDRSGSDEPRAIHEIPKPGELGPDLEGEEGVLEISKEVLQRLAFDGVSVLDSGNQFLAHLAVLKPTPITPSLVSKQTLKAMRRFDPGFQESWRQDILDLLNEGLAERTADGGRYLYLIAEDDEPLIQGLRETLPQLKIVTLAGTRDQIARTNRMLRQLRTVFLRRHHHEGSKS